MVADVRGAVNTGGVKQLLNIIVRGVGTVKYNRTVLVFIDIPIVLPLLQMIIWLHTHKWYHYFCLLDS